VITASSIERGKRCPGHATLPHRDVPTKEAEAGTERHGDREVAINAGDVPSVLTERWPGLTWRAEVKFAYDLSTGKGRELGQGNDRDYSAAGPFELVGTADVVGIGPDKIVIVDWKSFKEVPRATVNMQLHIAALALSRAHCRIEAEVAIHYENRPMDVAALDMIDLDSFGSEIVQIMDEVARVRLAAREGAPVVFVEGRHCEYCPGFYDCPKKKALEQQVLRHPALVHADKAMLPFADDDDAAAAYDFWIKVGELHKRLGAALYARGNERPIPLKSGKLFGKREKLGNREIDGDKAYDLIREKYGQAIADLAVTREASQVQIEKALKTAGVASVKGAKDELLTTLEKAGGVTRKKKTAVEEYDATPAITEKAS